MVKADSLRTACAQQAVDFGEVFRSLFAAVQIDAKPPRRVELVVPDGPSTQGGRFARQNINLVAADPKVPVVTVGWVNVQQAQAQLRSYAYIVKVFRQRFADQSIGIEPLEYEKFLLTASDILQFQKLELNIETKPPNSSASSSQAEEESPPPSAAFLIAVVVVTALLGMAISYWLLSA